jgi:hypothetical protein
VNQNPINSSVKFTSANAPRDVKELIMLGRFRLRDLANEVGMGDTPETRASLSNMEVEKMAEEVLRRLLQIDASNGGAMVQSVQGGQLIQMPMQQAAEPAQQAPKRSPTNAATRAAKAAGMLPAATGQASTTGVALEDVLETVKNLATEITNNTQQIKALANVLAGIQQAQAATMGALQSSIFQTQLNTSLGLLFGEQVLQGRRPDILSMAIGDIPQILDLVGKAQPGKK